MLGVKGLVIFRVLRLTRHDHFPLLLKDVPVLFSFPSYANMTALTSRLIAKLSEFTHQELDYLVVQIAKPMNKKERVAC